MHESALVAGILQAALDEVHAHNATTSHQRVISLASLTLEVGLLACVEEQTLKGCFEILAEGTLAEGATLALRRAPLPCQCRECGQVFELTRRHFFCPACGSENITFSGGHGCTLTSLDVNVEETPS